MGNKILYVQTSGLDTPERLYSPFHLAQAARAMGMEATIFFMIKGISVVKKGAANKIKLGGLPTLSKVIKDTVAMNVKLYVCDQSSQFIGLDRGNYIDEVEVVGSATLNDEMLEADTVLTL